MSVIKTQQKQTHSTNISATRSNPVQQHHHQHTPQKRQPPPHRRPRLIITPPPKKDELPTAPLKSPPKHSRGTMPNTCPNVSARSHKEDSPHCRRVRGLINHRRPRVQSPPAIGGLGERDGARKNERSTPRSPGPRYADEPMADKPQLSLHRGSPAPIIRRRNFSAIPID